MSQQIKTPDEQLAIALQRALNRWQSRPPSASRSENIRDINRVLRHYKTNSDSFKPYAKEEAEALINFSNKKERV
jgi:hypothetical protein